MNQEKLDRINQLARIKKERALTESEAAEQAALRAEYLAEFRAHFAGILDNTDVQYPDGSRQSLNDIRNQKKK